MSYKLNKKRNWGIILIFQFLLFYGASYIPSLTSVFTYFFEWRKNVQQNIFSSFNFSVGDYLYCLVGTLTLFIIIFIIIKKTRKKAGLILLIGLNIFYFLYQIVWGMLYFENPIIKKLPKEKLELEEVKELYLEYAYQCNELRKKVHENENGVFKIENLNNVKKEIILQQKNIPSCINSKRYNNIISIKPSIWNKTMSKTGILGYYNPFTAEAQYNPNMPDSMLPFTIAHETAHQLGYAREYEANFIGYLLSDKTKNIDIKYSTSLFLLKSLFKYLEANNVNLTESENNLSESVIRDLKFEQDFRDINESSTKYIFQTSNDLFLKSNRQKGRISYSYFTELFLRYKKRKEPRNTRF